MTHILKTNFTFLKLLTLFICWKAPEAISSLDSYRMAMLSLFIQPLSKVLILVNRTHVSIWDVNNPSFPGLFTFS